MLAGSLLAAAGWSEAGGAVRELTQQAGAAVMAGVFLARIDANPVQGYPAAAFGGKGAAQRMAGDRQPGKFLSHHQRGVIIGGGGRAGLLECGFRCVVPPAQVPGVLAVHVPPERSVVRWKPSQPASMVRSPAMNGSSTLTTSGATQVILALHSAARRALPG